MRTRLLVFALTMMVMSQAFAVGTVCIYQQEPCDDNGNHYECHTYGWIGDRTYCSAKDNTYPKKHALQGLIEIQKSWIEECIAQCMAETGHGRDFCNGSYCW